MAKEGEFGPKEASQIPELSLQYRVVGTALFKMDNQQPVTLQHRELCSVI